MGGGFGRSFNQVERIESQIGGENTATMTNKEEGIVIGIASTAGVLATYVLEQPIPIEMKVLLTGFLGALSLGLGTFWHQYINVTRDVVTADSPVVSLPG
jgi:hypothetical protein